MIFVDANVFLRYFVQPVDASTRLKFEIASSLFEAADHGKIQLTTTEVVLHEVLYILTAKSHYGVPIEKALELLRPVIILDGFKFESGEKQIYLRAFDIIADVPKLGFADAVVAARVERQGIPLATFDEVLGRLPFIDRWSPDSATTVSND